jgi:hypothetical protein
MKSYRAVIVPIDADQTPFRVGVLAESESEARRLLEQQYGENSVHALHEQVSTTRPPRRGTHS